MASDAKLLVMGCQKKKTIAGASALSGGKEQSTKMYLVDVGTQEGPDSWSWHRLLFI